MLQGIDRRENDFTNDVKDMPYEEFPEWCKLQYEYASGRLLPAGYVPQSIYWLYIDGEPVGIGKIRWKLTETSREAGGNIGYAISRQYRGHGYGTILLKSLIDIAKSDGSITPSIFIAVLAPTPLTDINNSNNLNSSGVLNPNMLISSSITL